jgi:hypothetical protein
MHTWAPTQSFAGARFVCDLCGAGKFVTLSGVVFTKGGSLLGSEPLCLIDVEALVVRAGFDEAWRVDEGGGKL